MITASTTSPVHQTQQLPSRDQLPKVAEQKLPSISTLKTQDHLSLKSISPKPTNIVQLFPPETTLSTQMSQTDPPSQQEIEWALQLENKVKQGYQPSPQETAIYESIAQRLQASQQPPTPAPLNLVEAQWARDMAQKIETGFYTPTKREMKHFMKLAQQALSEKSQEIFTQWPSSIPNPPDQDELYWALSVTRDYQFGEIANPRQLKHFSQVAKMVLDAHLEASKPQAMGGVSQEELRWALALQEHVQQGYQPTQQELERYTDIYSRYEAVNSPELPDTNKPDPCIMLEPYQTPQASQPAMGIKELFQSHN